MCIKVCIGSAVCRGCSMRVPGVPQAAGQAGAVQGGDHLGAAPGKDSAWARAGKGVPHMG